MKKKRTKIFASRIRSFVTWFGLFVGLLAVLFFTITSAEMQSRSDEKKIQLFDLLGTQKTGSLISIAGVREQEIKINFDKINFETTQRLSIPLLDGKSYEAVRRDSEGFVRLASDEFTWSGKIFDENDWSGDVILTVKDKALSGLIYSPAAVYEIIPQENFTHLLVELDQSRFPNCAGAIAVDKPAIESENKPSVPDISSDSNGLDKDLYTNRADHDPTSISRQNSLIVDDGSLIDVLVTYTAQVRQALGGTTQAQAFASQSIASANTAYQNSGITPRLRLAGTLEVSYTEAAGTLGAALPWVAGDAAVAAARNTTKADMVAIIIENASDGCGLAYVQRSVGASFAGSAFSSVTRGCAVGNLSFAHELGHNQGSEHNPENGGSPSQASYPYAFGHYVNGSFRTVMSYADPCPAGCTRVAYFSNPSVTFNGFATGIANQRDNHRVLNNTALIISQFRDSGGGGGGCAAASISLGQTISGSLTTSDCIFTGTTRYVDLYTFSGTAGQQIAVSMSSTGFDTYLYLVNSSNQTLGEDDDGGGGTNSRIPATSGFFTIPATGAYTIYATSFSASSTGTYSLTLSVNNSCSSAPVSVGQTVNGSLQSSDCLYPDNSFYDAYTFSGTAGQQIYITLNSPQFDAYLFLYQGNYPGGTVLTADNDGGGGTNARIPATSGLFTLPATGTYTILANSLSAGETGSYTLFLGTNVSPTSRKPFDFDGDGKTDISIFRPGVGEWWINRSSTNQTIAAQFGQSTDRITPGDFTGDGKTDIAFWRPSTGFWFILRSENGSFFSFPFGTNGDIPVPADYDGDGRTDAAVFRPSNLTWYILLSGGGTPIVQFGAGGDVPVAADYDGDGRADIAIFRPSVGQWWIQRSTAGLIAFQFGNSTDKPVQGDYTGDGRADAAFFRPSTGVWFVLRSENFSFFSAPFGTVGDLPAPGDYDGDGKFDLTVFRPSNSTWFIQRTTAGTQIITFGTTGDRPVPNAFVP